MGRTIPKNHQIIEISKEHYVFFLQISEQDSKKEVAEPFSIFGNLFKYPF